MSTIPLSRAKSRQNVTFLNGYSGSHDQTAIAEVGLLSVALGAAEMIAPRAIDRMIGGNVNPTLVELFGARELQVVSEF
jgi:hypothetical protein